MQQRKNVFLRCAVPVMVVAMVCASIYAGNTTLARYTAAASGSAQAEVAVFSVIVNTVDIAQNGNNTILPNPTANVLNDSFSLFSSVLDTADTADTADHVSGQGWGNPDANVSQPASGNRKIAPGTHGEFQIAAQNRSDVTVDLTFALTGTATALPIKWYIADGASSASSTKYDTLTEALAAAFGTNGTVRLAPGASLAATKTIGWIWAYGPEPTSEAADTPIGLDPPSGLTASLTATAIQVD